MNFSPEGYQLLSQSRMIFRKKFSPDFRIIYPLFFKNLDYHILKILLRYALARLGINTTSPLGMYKVKANGRFILNNLHNNRLVCNLLSYIHSTWTQFREITLLKHTMRFGKLLNSAT